MNACFIAGTDTDAGKSTVTAALLRAMAAEGISARAVKPVQTGCTDAGAPDVLTYNAAGGQGQVIRSFRIPCSPDLAARMEGRSLDAASLAEECRAAWKGEAWTFLEGAGGIHVPLNGKETMLDLMRALRLPVLLVVGNRLGCINHALLSLDALDHAGLTVLGMVLCRTTPPGETDAGTSPEAESLILEGNAEFLRREGKRRGVPLLANIPYLPSFAQDRMGCWDQLAELLRPVARFLIGRPESDEQTRRACLAFDQEHLWHPYTSALHPLPVRKVQGASGTRIFLDDGRELVDGMSSWWCKVHGYGQPRLVSALQTQAARLSHVMFGGLTHEPAVELGRRLLPLLPEGLEHLFYADSGSVAVEVAMKMAVQFWQSTGGEKKCRFVALRGAYHGDTLGAMSLCDPVTGMHSLFSGLLPLQIFVERPWCRFDTPYDPASFASMEETLRSHANEVAAVVVEPLVQGAGGMWFYHPQYLRDLRRLCDELEILLVADEIATGLGRTGRMFACDWAGISPDILCMGKALTGGMMTFSAVAASRRVAEGISGGDAAHGNGVFMHGPTFMGNPLACTVACASLDLLISSPWQERVERIRVLLEEGLGPCRSVDGVHDVRVLGAIGVIEMDVPVDVERWQDFFVASGVWIRPFGRTVYVMPPFVASNDDVRRLTSAMGRAVLSASRHGGIPVVEDAVC